MYIYSTASTYPYTRNSQQSCKHDTNSLFFYHFLQRKMKTREREELLRREQRQYDMMKQKDLRTGPTTDDKDLGSKQAFIYRFRFIFTFNSYATMDRGVFSRIGGPQSTLQWFTLMVIFSQAVGVLAIILLFIFLAHYRGGFAWHVSRSDEVVDEVIDWFGYRCLFSRIPISNSIIILYLWPWVWFFSMVKVSLCDRHQALNLLVNFS